MKEWIGLVARLVTGGVWLWAGAVKLPDLASSVIAVRAYEILPEALVPAVGHALPLLEVAVGLCLVLGVWVRPAAVLSALLFVAFIIGIASVWARGIQIDCGCFGGGGAKENADASYPWEIVRDVALLAASVWLVLMPTTRLALGSLLQRRTLLDSSEALLDSPQEGAFRPAPDSSADSHHGSAPGGIDDDSGRGR